MASNNINFKFLVTDTTKTTIIYNIELMDQVSDIDIKASKIMNKIVNGSYDRGILQGVYAVESGGKVSFSLPIYQNNGMSAQDITEYWKDILNNAKNYKFFLTRYQNNIQYYREMIPSDNLGYKSNFPNNAGKSKLNFQFLDNFYIGEELSIYIPEFSNVNQGIYTVPFESVTSIQTSARFKFNLNNNKEIYYSFSFYAKKSIGLSFNGFVPIDAVIEHDGKNLFISGTNSAKKIYLYNDNLPDIFQGITDLVFSTTYYVDNFTLKYNARKDF